MWCNIIALIYVLTYFSLYCRFNVAISGLIKLLVNIKSASSFGALSQLLLRLDFNRWFSLKRHEVAAL